MSAIAIRLSIAGKAVVIKKFGISFSINTDEQFLRSMCHSHEYDVDYFTIDRFDVCNKDRFETDNEQEVVSDAFTALWDLAHSNKVNQITKTVCGNSYYENLENFMTLYNHCIEFEIFKKGIV